jgi:hypothetical protein
MSTQKMNLQNQILVVNVGILGGLVFEYFRGTPIGILAGSGIVLLLLANIIFFIRLKKLKTTQ